MSLEVAAEKLKLWRDRPDIFVEECFGVIPDDWQRNVLLAFPYNQRLAMVACRGPGKTCVLAWLMWNFMLTRPHPKIAATSITGDNLADNLWSELSKWQQKSDLLKSQFTYTKTRVFCNEFPETWFMSARVWSKSADAEAQGNTLAGLHSDYIMFVLDESGGIPNAIMASAEAALSSCIEGHLVQAGNPTTLGGPLYRASTSERTLWHLTHITSDPESSNRTPRVSKEWATDQIARYGKDSPWILVNIYGQFPPSSINALIGPDEVNAAMKRYYRPQDFEKKPKILGVDVAREGLDSSVIFPRQGLQAFNPIRYRNIDGTQGAGLVARKWQDWGADAMFIDNTGGFGSSWVDNLRGLGYAPIPIHFSGKPIDPRYFNKRAEIIFECCQWVKDGGSLPECPELVEEMTQTTYTFKGDKLMVESKDEIKSRIGRSPDFFDALALTFSSPVATGAKVERYGAGKVQSNYNPLDIRYIEKDYASKRSGSDVSSYDPLSTSYLDKQFR